MGHGRAETDILVLGPDESAPSDGAVLVPRNSRFAALKYMSTIGSTFLQLADATARAGRIAYPLAELNDLLAAATSAEIENLPAPSIADPYRLNYVTAMVEVAAHRAGGMPPLWTADVAPLGRPVFIDPSLSLRAHLLTASPPPFRRRNIFIDSSVGDRV